MPPDGHHVTEVSQLKSSHISISIDLKVLLLNPQGKVDYLKDMFQSPRNPWRAHTTRGDRGRPRSISASGHATETVDALSDAIMRSGSSARMDANETTIDNERGEGEGGEGSGAKATSEIGKALSRSNIRH